MKINFEDILKILNLLQVSLEKDKIIKKHKKINEELISGITSIDFPINKFLKFVCSLWMIKSNYIDFVKNKIIYFLHRYNVEKGDSVDLENIEVLNKNLRYEKKINLSISSSSNSLAIFESKKIEEKKKNKKKKKKKKRR